MEITCSFKGDIDYIKFRHNHLWGGLEYTASEVSDALDSDAVRVVIADEIKPYIDPASLARAVYDALHDEADVTFTDTGCTIHVDNDYLASVIADALRGEIAGRFLNCIQTDLFRESGSDLRRLYRDLPACARRDVAAIREEYPEAEFSWSDGPVRVTSVE